jgi:ABC-type phosphate/phosphonate transport system substrate-binding protein
LHNGAHSRPATGRRVLAEEHMSSAKITCLLAIAALAAGCSQPVVSAESSGPTMSTDIDFLSILADQDTAAADARLKRFLERSVAAGLTTGSTQRVRFDQRTMSYGDVIRAFAEPDPGRGYLARITPYAYVAAELLGAKARILAVYQSAATSRTTYRSYFVVPKTALVELGRWSPGQGDASLEDVGAYLKTFKSRPPKFIYHDRFSTSSYFMPSLYFRAHDVFAMGPSLNPRLTPITVVKSESTSSSELVKQVAGGGADLAAVWDKTKNEYGSDGEVLFIPIPVAVPNDFLVASGIDEKIEKLIVNAIRKEPAADRACTKFKESAAALADGRQPRQLCDSLAEADRPRDDFNSWYPWDSYDDVTDAAREALAKLRQDARQKPTPVVVKVQGRLKDGTLLVFDEDRLLKAYVDATKEAVRLSGTEFVLWDPDLHRRVDMTWTLQSTHDGALTLRSSLEGFKDSTETFPISFVDGYDLPKRIADLVRSRLRRVRYVWPYEQKYPAVLRDLDFTPDKKVLVQKISWLDPERNEYEEDHPFEARIESNMDFSKLRLSDEIKFPKNPDGSFNFDPMSNIAYRVVIAREPSASWIWVALPYGFIALFGLACVGLAIDLRRKQPSPRGLQQTYEHMVDAYHQPWRTQQVEEGAILWCDEKYMGEFVKDLKTDGSLLDLLQSGGCDFNFGPIPVRFSVLMKIGSRLYRRPQLASELGAGGSVTALDALIQFLVQRRRLSPFIGLPEQADGGARPSAWPVEWEALNDIASRHFERLGIGDTRIDASLDGVNPALAAVVSSHFRGVVKKAARDASLLWQTWTIEPGTPGRLVFEGQTRATLMVTGQSGSARVRTVRLEVPVPATGIAACPGETTLRAWVLGKVLTSSVEGDVLALHVKPIAVLRDCDDHQH